MVRWPGRRDSSKDTEDTVATAGGESVSDPCEAPSAAAPGARGAGQVVINSGNATASHGGIAVTGIFSPTVHVPPEAMRPPAEVDAPAGLNNLPHQPGQFVGRSHDLDRLNIAPNTPSTALVQVVHGLGGVGKSTLAAHWAATRSHGCAPVRWITADSPAGVEQGLASLATALQPALATALPAETLAEWGKQWLASHTGWLLILDNVNDPADIAPLIARAPNGRFLITSRLATAWSDATTLLRLDVMDEAESLALLTRITTAAGPRDLTGASELCTELGHLPLAIDQAAAYLAQNPLVTPNGYLQLLIQHPATMYSHGGATTPNERTIAQVWNITLDRITHLQALAADLLRVLAWYAPENIPVTLFDCGQDDPAARQTALGLLTAYNMVTVDTATGTLAVHRLVQALARTPDANDPHRAPGHIAQAREQATANLRAAVPGVWSDLATWPAWRTLIPHIDAFTGHAAPDTDTDTIALILGVAGRFLSDQGQPARAIRYHQRALSAFERLEGEHSSSVQASRHALAVAYETAGDLDTAISLYEQNLRDSERVLGTDHPDTLTSRSSLASAYASAGNLEQAIRLHEQNLIDELRVLGAEHPYTLTARNNLGLAYQEAGDLAHAIPLHEQTLADRSRVLGEDHPDTLTSRNNLAGAYQEAGDLAHAIPLHEQTLADRLRVLGEDHPDTLASRNNLASAYRDVGDLGSAIPLFEQALADQLRVMGADHPYTLTFRNNLASAYQEAGDLAHAIPLLEQTLADRSRVLGEDHPGTLAARDNLALARQQGEPRVASPAPQQSREEHVGAAVELVEERTHSLGADHPDTLQAQAELAYKRGTAGDPSGAAATQETLLEACRRVLGLDHPDTLTTLGILAHWREEAGDHSGAATAWKELLAARVRVLGPDHPDTVQAWDQLASSLAKAGDPDGAAAAIEEVIAGRMRLLRPDHPDVLSARGHLAYYRGVAGDVDEAATAFTRLLDDCLRILGPDHPNTRTTREGAAYWQARADEEAP
ncbi:FxSxx-COOH system tetratricopeptide repeat protein [Streptomyces sp. NPDC059567]|uniref:FxSxx-COOH system tetratricopeptide repeat protein n=1 Tax=Streptomyces sp. NPDC059567 TaxID=3346867 RepID=UPI003684514B